MGFGIYGLFGIIVVRVVVGEISFVIVCVMGCIMVEWIVLGMILKLGIVIYIIV